jgi:hypothetical protein
VTENRTKEDVSAALIADPPKTGGETARVGRTPLAKRPAGVELPFWHSSKRLKMLVPGTTSAPKFPKW